MPPRAPRAASAGPAGGRVRRTDKFQQRHDVLGFPYAVVQKFGNDQAGSKAALIAYYGLFAIFPLLMLFTTILGYVLQRQRPACARTSSTAHSGASRSSAPSCSPRSTA